MKLKLIEATNHGPTGEEFNWGKFAVGRFDEHERLQRSVIDSRRLIGSRGWTAEHIFVLDLQTGEGALFLPGGSARADLAKHKIWVCPLFEPTLAWLYEQDLSDLDALPDKVGLDFEQAAVDGGLQEGGAMSDPMLKRLARAAAKFEQARRVRDETILEAAKTHSVRVIGKAVGLSHGRIVQILGQMRGGEEKP